MEDLRKDFVMNHLDVLSPDDVLKMYSPDDRLKGLTPREGLKGIPLEEIEEYLKQSQS